MSFLKFEKMITPIFIQFMFWIGFIGSFFAGLIMIGYGILSNSGGFTEVLIGLGTFILGPIVIRIYCEMLIVAFKIQGSLQEIRDGLVGDEATYEKEEAI